MKKICLLIVLALGMAPGLFAQDEHVVELGAFFDYSRFTDFDQNFFGIGGRFGVNPHPNVGIEAEASYYFRRSVGDATDLNLTDPGFRIVPALVGLKFHNNGPLRVYATLKGGLVNLGADDNLGGIISGFNDSTTKGAFYPGAGFELGSGFFGLRLEAGDLIYWQGGANHNLRITVGPTFRF